MWVVEFEQWGIGIDRSFDGEISSSYHLYFGWLGSRNVWFLWFTFGSVVCHDDTFRVLLLAGWLTASFATKV